MAHTHGNDTSSGRKARNLSSLQAKKLRKREGQLLDILKVPPTSLAEDTSVPTYGISPFIFQFLKSVDLRPVGIELEVAFF